MILTSKVKDKHFALALMAAVILLCRCLSCLISLAAHLAQKIASSNIIYYKEFGQFASLGLSEQQVPGSLYDNEQNQMLASKKNVFLSYGNK